MNYVLKRHLSIFSTMNEPYYALEHETNVVINSQGTPSTVKGRKIEKNNQQKKMCFIFPSYHICLVVV